MLGGFFGAKSIEWLVALTGWTDIWLVTLLFIFGVLLGVCITVVIASVVEFGIFRRLYSGSHLDHVLATFGLLLFFNEFAKILFGSEPMNVPKPPILEFARSRSFPELPIRLIGWRSRWSAWRSRSVFIF